MPSPSNPTLSGIVDMAAVQHVKLYKTQCEHLWTQCSQLRLTLQGSTQSREGTSIADIKDEADSIVGSINRQMVEWGSWNRLTSLLRHGEIKDGVDRLNRELDNCMVNLNTQMSMKINRGHLSQDNSDMLVKVYEDLNSIMRNRARINWAVIEREGEREIRKVLQTIVESEDDMNALLHGSAAVVEEFMGTLQTQLMIPELELAEVKDFKRALGKIYEKTGKLPPLTDLTGQITLVSRDPFSTGSSSKTFQGVWLNEQKVGLRLPRVSDNSALANEYLKREVTRWRGLHHPNVLQFYGTIKIRENVYSVTPWMDNGILLDYVRNDPSVDRRKLLSQIASGLEYLHKHQIIHGDLRGANVLISPDRVACLSDFGLSKVFENLIDSRTSNIPSLRWMAPEVVIRHVPVSIHSDSWSFGMVCLEVLTGQEPFYGKDDKKVIDLLKGGKPPDRPKNMQPSDNEIWKMMQKCWAKNPRDRLAMVDASPFLERARSPDLPESPTRLKPFAFLKPRAGSSQLGGPSDRRPQIDTSYHGSTTDPSLIGSPISSLSTGRESDFFTTSPIGMTDSDETGMSPIGGFGAQHQLSGESDLRRLSAIQEATSNPYSILNIVDDVVESGTLEGLIKHLIERFGRRRYRAYPDVFLMSCPDFTTPDALFQTIRRRFFDAEDSSEVETRVNIQFNTLLVLEHWLKSGYFAPNQELLYRMKIFGENALKLQVADTLRQKTKRLLQVVQNKVEQQPPPPSLLNTTGRVLHFSDLKPRGLAIALTLLEGDNYKSLLPSDYIMHFARGESDNINKVDETNKKIIVWVIESVQHYDELQKRAEVMGLFIRTAHECWQMRNFSSTIAIATALHSTEIKNLQMTTKALTQSMGDQLAALYNFVRPEYSYHHYQEALGTAATSEERNVCIPWLPVHLKELKKVLQQNQATIEVDGQHLINFRRYTRFMDRIKEVVYYSPPNVNEEQHIGHLGYLVGKLRTIDVSVQSKEKRVKRSVSLIEKEIKDHRTRRVQMQHLGFDIPT